MKKMILKKIFFIFANYNINIPLFSFKKVLNKKQEKFQGWVFLTDRG